MIIVNWNTRDLLKRCLDSVAVSQDGELYEVIVVDNGSVDDSWEMVRDRFPWVRLVRNEETLGFARATNQGFRLARGKYVLMLNSDTSASLDALRKCAHYLDEHTDVAVVGCQVTFPDGSPQSSCFRFPSIRGVVLTSTYLSQIFRKSPCLNWDRYGCRRWTTPQEVDCVMGGFMMVRVGAIARGSFLNEGYFMYGEEVDLCYSLKKRGWKVVFYPDAQIVHDHGGSSKTPELEAWAYTAKRRAIIRFLKKWRGASAAYLGNTILLLGLFPRSVVWFLQDAVETLVRWKKPLFRRTLKARAFRFHLAALVVPGFTERNWQGPDATRSDHR